MRRNFNRKTCDIAAVRDALIEHDLDDLTDDVIADIAAVYWEDFKPLALRYLEAKWASGSARVFRAMTVALGMAAVLVVAIGWGARS
jgi:hypothetical protein